MANNKLWNVKQILFENRFMSSIEICDTTIVINVQN